GWMPAPTIGRKISCLCPARRWPTTRGCVTRCRRAQGGGPPIIGAALDCVNMRRLLEARIACRKAMFGANGLFRRTARPLLTDPRGTHAFAASPRAADRRVRLHRRIYRLPDDASGEHGDVTDSRGPAGAHQSGAVYGAGAGKPRRVVFPRAARGSGADTVPRVWLAAGRRGDAGHDAGGEPVQRLRFRFLGTWKVTGLDDVWPAGNQRSVDGHCGDGPADRCGSDTDRAVGCERG